MHAYGRIDDLDLKATIVQVLDRWPCAGLAIAVRADGGIAWFRGHGFADVAAKTPVTYAWTSSTSVFRSSASRAAGYESVGRLAPGPLR
jgi:CubicO group peptidase (beta-lactamase class C family)